MHRPSGEGAEKPKSNAPLGGKRPRVLVLSSTFPRWRDDVTQPPFVYNLCSRLADRMDVTVLAPHHPGSKSAEQWDSLDVVRFRYCWPTRFERIGYGGILTSLKRSRWLWFLLPLYFASEFFAALRIVRLKQIDILHAHWVIPQGIVAVLVKRITGTPVLVTAHGGDIYALRGKLQERIKRWTLNQCDHITAVSHDLLEAIQALGLKGQQPSDVISMGVDTRQFHPGHREAELRERFATKGPFILFVGRLTEKKGVRYLLEAMPAVLCAFPESTLVVVGDGPLRDELEALAGELCITGQVRFVGGVSPAELPAYYATADLFVGPSVVAESGDTESFGVVFAEAMASGCPVVGSDVGGTRDIIVDQQTGLLVPERDPTAIAQAVCRMMSDGTLRRRLREAGPRWARERFDQQVVADKYAAVIADAGRSVTS